MICSKCLHPGIELETKEWRERHPSDTQAAVDEPMELAIIYQDIGETAATAWDCIQLEGVRRGLCCCPYWMVLLGRYRDGKSTRISILLCQ